MTTNPRNIEWPQDTAGFLNGLRNEGVKAATRQMGNPDKHVALMETLRTIAKHAKARYEQQAANRADAIASVAAESDPLGELGAAAADPTPEPVEPIPAPADEAPAPAEPEVPAPVEPEPTEAVAEATTEVTA